MNESMGIRRGPVWWPLRTISTAPRQPGVRSVALLWLTATVLSVASALTEAALDWSGMPVTIFGITIPVTFYPPLIICWLLTLWLGPTWGLVPAYLATLASGLYSGMAWPVAAIFATALPIELLIVWGAMVIFEVHPDLPRRGDVIRYLGVSLVAATASSLAGLVYIETLQLGLIEGRSIWQGWVVGDTLQLALIGLPVLRLAGGKVRHWVDRQFSAPPRMSVSYTRSLVIVVILVTMLAAVVFQGVIMLSESLDLPANAITPSGELLLPRLREMGLFLGILLVLSTATTVLFAAAVARMGEQARGAVLRDLLTGCLNRAGFYEDFRREADRSRRIGKGIAVIIIDVDHFKLLNDTYGREMGDNILRQLVRRVQAVIREHDTLFRWGGEEFVILTPHTDPEAAIQLAERIRRAVADDPLIREDVPRPLHVTVSLGVAGTLDTSVDPNALIAQAETGCRQAKLAGRNQVGVSGGAGPRAAGSQTTVSG